MAVVGTGTALADASAISPESEQTARVRVLALSGSASLTVDSAEGSNPVEERGDEAMTPVNDLLLVPAPVAQPSPAPRAQSAGTITITRVITYTYDPLNRLTGATYSTPSTGSGQAGERFEYAYDAVGNRTVMTDATGVTTYTYDAANRLTSVGGVSYTWDERGNLTSDGTFTYTYNAAGRMVRAEGVTLTLVYTYNANGLRVAQSVDGAVITFSWDWATGVPELLAAAESTNPEPMLYLVGHETLGSWDGATWAYHLPDALGSLRQVADGAGAVTVGREWMPYGVEVGGAQAGLGYTGEWHDSNVGLTYLRVRWYAPYLNQFISPDTIVPDFFNPQSINRYAYVLGNPINHIDPSGLCAQLPGDSTDCECFVAEVEYIIEVVKEALRSSCLHQALYSEEALALDVLAWCYSGIPFTNGSIYYGFMPLPPNFEGFPEMPAGTPRDRYRVPDWSGRPQDAPVFEWNHPLNYPDSEEGQAMRAAYGFKRAYFEQTHHYFGYLDLAYDLGRAVAKIYNYWREIEDELKPSRELVQLHWGEPDYPEFYRFHYREAIGDLYVVDQACDHALAIAIFGIDILPGILKTWCAEDEADVWSLEGEINEYYFDFPREYWPEVVLEGWPEG